MVKDYPERALFWRQDFACAGDEPVWMPLPANSVR